MTTLDPTYCSVEKWSVVAGQVQYPSQILGRTTWAQLLTYMATNKARRLTYDLFECAEADGSTTRYRATDLNEEIS